MRYRLVRLAKITVLSAGLGAIFYIVCRLFGYQPDSLSYFWGIFMGYLMGDLIRSWIE